MDKEVFTDERQMQIISLIRKQKRVFVNDLASLFNVTATTIRNDLTALEKKGDLKRTHGGAILVSNNLFEMTNEEKENLQIEEKYRIAEYAATLVDDGDTIAIDSGTTMCCFAECLKQKKNLTVVTNDIKIAIFFEKFPNVETILVGGVVRKGFACPVGTLTNEMIKKFNVDKSFVVGNTVNESMHLCTASTSHADTKRCLMDIGKKKYLLIDSTKFNKTSLVSFASLNEFEEIVTDINIDEKTEEKIKEINENIKLV